MVLKASQGHVVRVYLNSQNNHQVSFVDFHLTSAWFGMKWPSHSPCSKSGGSSHLEDMIKSLGKSSLWSGEISRQNLLYVKGHPPESRP